MISVIISSVDKKHLLKVQDNINATIGVPYEVIATDNSSGQTGLCEVYNQAAQQAKYNILCFMHEDVIIKTNNWGKKVQAIFAQDEAPGLLGVVGSSYKTAMPSGWHCYGLTDVLHYHIIQSYKRSNLPDNTQYNNHRNEKLTNVACVDGVWLCTPKKVWEEVRFDENLLKRFHGYDVDFSLAVNQKYDVAVTYDIVLNHLSEGSFDKEWVTDTIKIQRKWKHILPLNIAGLSKKDSREIEWRTFKVFAGQLQQFNISPLKYRDVFLNTAVKNLGIKLTLKILYYLIKKSI